MADRLSIRALNRATLARQMLLRRESVRPNEALERLVGLQAQSPPAPYVGLWTRLERFDPEELSRLILSRRAVRIALMRGTIHLVSARDALAIRPLVQPMIVRATYGGHGRLLAGLDDEVLATAGRRLLDEGPLTLMELGTRLKKRWPDRNPSSLAMAIRAHVPLVQIPPRGLWKRSGGAKHTSADAWIGRPLSTRPNAAKLLLRYLSAFGPASLRDAQAWSGLAFGEVARRIRPKLRVFTDERGRELFDIPDAPRPNPDEPAPPRFLPEFDNVLLSFDVRSRIVSDLHRPGPLQPERHHRADAPRRRFRARHVRDLPFHPGHRADDYPVRAPRQARSRGGGRGGASPSCVHRRRARAIRRAVRR